MPTVTIERNSVNWLRINNSLDFETSRLSEFAQLSTYINDATSETFEVKYIRPELRFYTIHRVFADFDLTSIPNGSVITDIKVYIFVKNTNIDRFYVVPGGESLLAGNTSDFSRYVINNLTSYGNFYPNVADKITISLNENEILFPLGGVDYFSLGFIQIGDFSDDINLTSEFSFLTENNGTSYPYLEITYTEPSGFSHNVLGVSNATINSIVGVNKTTISTVIGK